MDASVEPRTSDVLRMAASIIRDRGWAQGHDSYRSSPCAGLAIDEAARTLGVDALVAHGALSRFRGEGPAAPRDYVDRTIEWNDAPDRTREEVIDALERCASEVDGGSGHDG